ncbi:hypothetical protein FJU30_15965 [Affinibrenneria salicis]|uniref:Uncharacterized protein n=1 Tax=Affinibrenneria salicis TaxID=2590031 RepID=A0A5J5FZA7_9GAMM|nr:hypothetical protein FJU30_15965 [Affinibrenneria salicis]
MPLAKEMHLLIHLCINQASVALFIRQRWGDSGHASGKMDKTRLPREGPNNWPPAARLYAERVAATPDYFINIILLLNK